MLWFREDTIDKTDHGVIVRCYTADISRAHTLVSVKTIEQLWWHFHWPLKTLECHFYSRKMGVEGSKTPTPQDPFLGSILARV